MEELIRVGRLFVPRHEVAKVDLMYLRRPGGGSRPLQARWVPTSLATCFDELTDALDWSSGQLTIASEVARRLAGTSRQARPRAVRHVREAAPYLELQTPRIWDPGPELAGLDR